MTDISAGLPESLMDQDDAAYPCKGCGEILEEGKAFELAGNRWHIDCFRCNTCGTLLDSDANLLLLGDGSLICNNCTYSCSACGSKIEDLAILTGDQAFCATCFRCRNCKKKIENLKYARTSQGIFCMECHESLMQRRRKKTKNGAHRHKQHQHQHHPQASNTNMLLDKSLPSLPQNAFVLDTESVVSDGYSDTPTELPRISQKRPSDSRSSSHTSNPTEQPRASQKMHPNPRSASSRSTRRDHSPAAALEDDRKEGLTLPSSTFKNNRHSAGSQRSDILGGGEEFFIPMAFDPNPAPGPSPLTRDQPFESQEDGLVKTHAGEGKTAARDYFPIKAHVPASRQTSQDYETLHSSSAPDSPRDSRHSSQPSSPRLAYRELSREPSSDLMDTVRKRKDQHVANNSINSFMLEHPRDLSHETRPHVNTDSYPGGFVLQEAPKSKRSGGSTRSSKSEGLSPTIDTSLSSSKSSSAPVSAGAHTKEQPNSFSGGGSPPTLRSHKALNEPQFLTHNTADYDHINPSPSIPHTPKSGGQLHELPQRSDSLAKSGPSKHQILRREVGAGRAGKLSTTQLNHEIENDPPASAPPSAVVNQSVKASGHTIGNRSILKPIDSPSSRSVTDIPYPPVRARDRERLILAGGSSSDSFIAPRQPPNPPVADSHKARHESFSTQRSESSRNGDQPASPALLNNHAAGEVLSGDDDTARLLYTEEHQDHASFLRRVSNSVRHARSYSDRGTRLSKEQRWPKSPLIGSPTGAFTHEISSPTTSSPESREEIAWFKNELRRERQKTVEKEQRLLELEAALEAKTNIRQMNKELGEKRSTMVVLDTQKEIIIRELEILTEHIAAAKQGGEPLDLGRMTSSVLQEFAEALQALKETFTPQIEDLTQKRNDLVEEVSNLTQLKDKSFQEFEQVSLKNAQLAELNNQLVHQIQELYKANAGPSLDIVRHPPNGLGIFAPNPKEKYASSLDGQDVKHPSIAESSLSGSTAVQENEGDPAAYGTAPQVINVRKAQMRKFNWKKGGQNVAKGVKGLKGAFSSNDPNKINRDGQTPETTPYASLPPSQDHLNGSHWKGTAPDPARQGFRSLFENPKAKPQHFKNLPNGTNLASHGDHFPTLFGCDLDQRTEYEKATVPCIVMRCIQEVEHRGMDIEGIYRKSGGNSQVQQIKEGFERTNDYDISDPDLDINAVTSTLKQYFRKLPTPLITSGVYDKFIDCALAHGNQEDPGRCIALMRAAINDLPSRHRDCLQVLVFHLARVVERERENLMTSLNIAVVFAPTIMRVDDLSREMGDTQAKNQAVQFLIENCQGVFLRDEE